MDEGFKQSEKMLNALEKKIHAEYSKAAKEVAKEYNVYFAKFEAEDKEKRKEYEAGKITKKEYSEWRQAKMLRGKQFRDLRDTLAQDLTNTDKIAMSYVRNDMVDVYALNVNYETYVIEHGTHIDTSFTLYNRDAVQIFIKDNPELLPRPSVYIPKDLRWNKQHINSIITQGILQGKSIQKVAKEMQRVTGMDERAAIRNARTAMTGAQNGGRLQAMKRAEKKGIKQQKVWVAKLDNVTRDSHVDLDGEAVDLDKPFSNGLMFPGDSSGEPAEVYNCRCGLATDYEKYKTEWSNLDLREHSGLGDMSYEEWKDSHRKHAEEVKQRREEREKAKK